MKKSRYYTICGWVLLCGSFVYRVAVPGALSETETVGIGVSVLVIWIGADILKALDE